MENQIIVVTGSSSGIGKAIAVQAAKRGASLVLHARKSESRLKQVQQQVEQLGAKAKYLLCDFSKNLDAEDFVAQAWRQFGRIDGWVNNAGGDVLTGESGSWSVDDKLEYLWKSDVRATFQLSRAIANRMRDQAIREELSDGYWVVNMGWDQAEHGMAGDSGEIFATTKGAIMSMTRSLAQSFAPQVRINCVCPGWIKTEWGETASEYWDSRAKRESLMARWGTADDVANVVSYLGSDAASFVSGQTLSVNGGFRLSNDLPQNDWQG